jgi:hypothetical protein
MNYKEMQMKNQEGHLVRKIKFDLKVRSEEYHKITTLLYEMTFDVAIPEKAWNFKGTIINYSTSITNLYEANQVGLFYLELQEVE